MPQVDQKGPLSDQYLSSLVDQYGSPRALEVPTDPLEAPTDPLEASTKY